MAGPLNFAAIYYTLGHLAVPVCLGTPQFCCYLLHFRPSRIRGASNPSALPIESAFREISRSRRGQGNIGGHCANRLPDPLGRFSGSAGAPRHPLGAPEGPKSKFRIPGALNLDLRRSRFVQFRCAKIRILWGAERQIQVLGSRSIELGSQTK